MDEQQVLKKLKQGIHKAMNAEHEGQHFYLMAARSCDDSKGREVLEQLAMEELEHFNFLRAQYDSVLKIGKPDESVKLGNAIDLSGSTPIFSEGIKERLKEAHFEMMILSVAAELELNAKRTYAALAEENSNPVVKKFFEQLSDWEAGHYRALTQQQTALQEEYWAANGFAPF
jgi:rubrerythrin